VTDYLLSSMPINELISNISPKVDENILQIATNLEYRNFVTVGILTDEKTLKEIADTWFYIHEPGVLVGRIQFFHNWSKSMVKTKGAYLLGLEYFCDQDDEFWNMPTNEISKIAVRELIKLGILKDGKVLNTKVEKVEKAYPVYSGVYSKFNLVKDYINGIENLYPIGRNGMHKYNNQDHSMLTAIKSVESIISKKSKNLIWEINAEQEYHEQK
jgi:protoporphyrinogen oxidase